MAPDLHRSVRLEDATQLRTANARSDQIWKNCVQENNPSGNQKGGSKGDHKDSPKGDRYGGPKGDREGDPSGDQTCPWGVEPRQRRPPRHVVRVSAVSGVAGVFSASGVCGVCGVAVENSGVADPNFADNQLFREVARRRHLCCCAYRPRRGEGGGEGGQGGPGIGLGKFHHILFFNEIDAKARVGAGHVARYKCLEA